MFKLFNIFYSAFCKILVAAECISGSHFEKQAHKKASLANKQWIFIQQIYKHKSVCF